MKDLISTHYDMDEVNLIKARLSDLEDRRLTVIFDAIAKANTIMGRQSRDSISPSSETSLNLVVEAVATDWARVSLWIDLERVGEWISRRKYLSTFLASVLIAFIVAIRFFFMSRPDDCLIRFSGERSSMPSTASEPSPPTSGTLQSPGGRHGRAQFRQRGRQSQKGQAPGQVQRREHVLRAL